MTLQKDINLRKRNFENAARREIGQPKEMAQPLSAPSAVSGGGSSGRRAVIVSVSAYSFSCLLRDSSGSPSGSVITVYPNEHLGSNPLTGNVWPKYSTGRNLDVFLDVNGEWYTPGPFDDTEEGCS